MAEMLEQLEQLQHAMPVAGHAADMGPGPFGGWGWFKGKGKGKRPREQPGPREQVTFAKVTGTLIEWRGKFGWIVPHEPISHPEAVKRQGQIYLSIADVEEELPGVGCDVCFNVYADGTGLGAANVGPVGGETVQRSIEKPVPSDVGSGRGRMSGSEGLKPPDKSLRQRVTDSPVSGTVVKWRGKLGWIETAEPIDHPSAAEHRGQICVHECDVEPAKALPPGASVVFFIYSDTQGLGAEHVQLVQAPEGGGDVASMDGEEGVPTPPLEDPPSIAVDVQADLPRTRLTDVPITGDVVEWNRISGWFVPHEPLDHPASSLREGKIYAHSKEMCAPGTKVEVGMLVQFHVYTDGQGLGAEEIALF